MKYAESMERLKRAETANGFDPDPPPASKSASTPRERRTAKAQKNADATFGEGFDVSESSEEFD